MMRTENSGETPPRRTFVAIGGFRPVDESQATGGQQTACAALFSTPLATRHQWLYVDTTASGAEAKHRSDRVKRGLGRLGQLAQYGVRRDVAGALIFTSAHLSFVEKGLVAVAMKRAGKRVVFCPRSGLILDDWNRSATFRHFLPWVFRHCDAVVCQGQSWRRRFIDMGADPDTLEVIPNWIDPGWQFNMTPREANTISARKQVRFLFVGRLEAYKGIWDLLDAIVARRHQLAGCVFELAGGGSCESELRRRIALHGLQDQVILRGWIGGEVKRNAFRDADCLVLPSHREGMPNVVLEAMAAQVPVLATDVGGTPDIIEHSGLGMLVPAGAPEALATALVAMATDPERRAHLARAGHTHVLQRHHVDLAWPKFEALLLGQRSANTRDQDVMGANTGCPPHE